MIKIIILLSMIFFHIKDDYNQGIMAQLKCKDWWKKNEPNEKYKYDYIIVLITHGFSWCFAIHIPILLYYFFTTGLSEINQSQFLLLFFGNVILHGLIDHLKANMRKINLTFDQIFHIFQIINLWLFYIIKII